MCVRISVMCRQSEKYKQQQWVETAANSLKEIRPMMLVIVAAQQTSTWRLKLLLLLLLLRACSWGHAKVSRQPYSRTLSWVQVECELRLHSTIVGKNKWVRESAVRALQVINVLWSPRVGWPDCVGHVPLAVPTLMLLMAPTEVNQGNKNGNEIVRESKCSKRLPWKRVKKLELRYTL